MNFFKKFFLDFYRIFGFFEFFFRFFFSFLDLFGFFLDFIKKFGFFSKLLWLLVKVTEVTTEHQKISKNSIKISKPKGQKNLSAEGRSPPQELEESPHSGLYLLVFLHLFGIFVVVVNTNIPFKKERSPCSQSIIKVKQI